MIIEACKYIAIGIGIIYTCLDLSGEKQPAMTIF